MYFGVLPVLLFYLPFYLLTGSSFPTAIGVLIACIMFVLGVTALMDRFARHHFKRVSLGLFLLLQMPLVACSGMLYLAKFPTFYSLPIAMALAFTVWGLYFGFTGGQRKRAADGTSLVLCAWPLWLRVVLSSSFSRCWRSRCFGASSLLKSTCSLRRVKGICVPLSALFCCCRWHHDVTVRASALSSILSELQPYGKTT